MATKKTAPPGPVSLFRGKDRKPVSLTLTPAHHQKVRDSMKRLHVTRADLFGLLVDKCADSVEKEPAGRYERLKTAIAALGGTLEREKFKGPLGASWVLTLGRKTLEIHADPSQRYPALDSCFRQKDDVVDLTGLAQLFKQLESEGVD